MTDAPLAAVEVSHAPMRGRLFARNNDDPLELAARVADTYLDDDDARREPLLRALLGRPFARAVAYPTVSEPDVLQVFVGDDAESTFACVVVSGARLQPMLEQSPWVLEGFSLQVAAVVTVDGVRAALQAWSARNFPDLVPPEVFLVIEPHAE